MFVIQMFVILSLSISHVECLFDIMVFVSLCLQIHLNQLIIFIIAMMQIQTSIISKIIFAIKRTLFEHPEVALRVDFNKINLGMFPLSYYIHEINPNAFCSVLLHLYYRL